MTGLRGSHSNIQNQLFRQALPLVLLLIAVVSAIHAGIAYYQGISTLHKNARIIIATQSEPLKTALWGVDREQIAAQLGAIVLHPNIRYAAILKDSLVQHESGEKNAGQHLTWNVPLTVRFNGRDADLGMLYFEADTGSMIQNVLHTAFWNAFFQSITILVAALVVMRLHQQAVLRHIVCAADYFSEHGNVHAAGALVLDKVPAGDEIDRLVGAFNGMRTELVTSYQLLSERETRYRLLSESTSAIVWQYDIQADRWTYVAPQAETMLGYPPEEWTDVAWWMEKIHPEDREWAPEYCRNLTMQGQDHSFEYRFITRSGKVVWLNDTVNVEMRDSVPVVMRGILLDVSERKQAQEKLVASEHFLRIMTDQLPGMVGYWDTELHCGFANKAYQEWFGKTPEQMLGITMQELLGIELFSKSEPYILSALKGEPQHFERTLKKPSGETGYTWAHYIPNIIDNTVRGFFVLVSDVTALKQAQEAVRESETRLRLALEGTNDGLWDIRMDTGRTYLSPRGGEILGYREDEIEEVVKVLADLVHPEDMQLTKERLSSHIEGRAEIFEVEQRLQTKSGGWKWIYTRGKVVERAADGTPLRITGTYSDITEKKHLELQLHQAQKMESIGRLAGGVAHDFNNLLTVILGYANIGLMGLDPTQPNYHIFEEICKAAERSAALTRQLLAFARKQTIAPKVLDLNDTVENMLKMLRRLIGEDIDLAWHPSKSLGQVKIDPSQLDQILANLCVNARDAISDVGKITIETGLVIFDRAYCDANKGFMPGEYVLLALSDNGCGMDKETMSHVFEPFFTTKGLGEGTGLGLATVYGIVKQNNGFINVYSEPGHGTTFKIYLPRYENTVGTQPDKKEARPVIQGRETILLVEDEKSILEITTILLEKQGYTVLAANTPGDAIELAKKLTDEIDLLMTDVVMPDMNGRDLAENITLFNPNIKILYMSGYTANVIAHHGILDDGINFINKPFSFSSLSAKLRKILNK